MNGSREQVRAPITAEIVALAPAGAHWPAVAGAFELSWLDEDAPPLRLPGKVRSAAVTDGGTVVALTYSDTDGTRLCVYSGAGLAEVVEPVALGHAWAHAVELDTDTSVLMAGLNRSRPTDDGQPYLRRVSWVDGRASVVWSGDGVPDDVDLARASGSHLVVVRGKQLVVAALDELSDGDGRSVRTSDVGADIEALAISPDGTWIAVVVDDGVGRVRTRRFDGSRFTDRGSVPEGLTAIEIAVADDGSVTVAGLRSPTEVVIAVAADRGELAERWQIEQPRSVFRDDR